MEFLHYLKELIELKDLDSIQFNSILFAAKVLHFEVLIEKVIAK